jgi:hypothetical protein
LAGRPSCYAPASATLGGALIGAATVGGLAALVDRSISAADGVGKTADKIGVGVEALQELRFDGASWVNEDSPYDVGMFIPGTHGNGALLAEVVLTRGSASPTTLPGRGPS